MLRESWLRLCYFCRRCTQNKEFEDYRDLSRLCFGDGPPLTSNGASYSDRRYVRVPPKFTSCQTIVSGEVKVTRKEPPGGLAFSS